MGSRTSRSGSPIVSVRARDARAGFYEEHAALPRDRTRRQAQNEHAAKRFGPEPIHGQGHRGRANGVFSALKAGGGGPGSLRPTHRNYCRAACGSLDRASRGVSKAPRLRIVAGGAAECVRSFIPGPCFL